MKSKKLVGMPLVAVLILSLIPLSATMVGMGLGYGETPPFGSSPTMWVGNHSKYSEDTSLVSTTFNVTVNIWNVSDMGVFEFKLSYNTTLLSAEYVYIDPPLYPEPTPGWDWLPEDLIGVWHPDTAPTINDTAGAGVGPDDGRVWVGCTIPTPGAGTGLYGSFALVTIRFHIDYAPPRNVAPPANLTVGCPLDLYDVVVGDWQGSAIPTALSDGYYEYSRGQIIPGAPHAEFTWNPPFPFVCDTVTCTSTSTPNGGSIVSYDWSLTGLGTWTSANGAPSRQFHCDGGGSVFVTLNVTDSEGMWDTVTHEIIQTEALGPIIDLYDGSSRQYPEGTWTPYNGTGLGADSDSYAPGENVSLYAEVTFNGDVVQNIPVGFEVKNPLGEPIVVRTARTDENGIATICFRLPIPGPTYPELNETMPGPVFGHWWVIAKCKVQDEIINDTKSFKVGWIVEITGLKTIPSAEWYKCDSVVINVTLKNIAWLPRNVTVVVVIYDVCDVPIGQVIIRLEIPAAPAVLCSKYEMSIYPEIHIPKWAYIGAGKVYGNVFTYLPQDCGIPYAPEVMYQILISMP